MSTARRLWLLVHRWAGLGAGALLVVAGLSGSFLAFYPQIDRALNPDWTTPQGQGPRATMQQVLDAARPAMPGRFLHSVFPPADEHDVHHVWFTPAADDGSAMWEVLVDPHTAQVLGQRTAVPVMEFSRRNLANTVYTLHFQLFMGETGSTIVGIAGVFLLASGLTGLVLWWPRGGRWRSALTIKRGSHGIRLHFDLHRVVALYSVVVLLLVAGTGVILSFPSYATPLVAAVSPLRPPFEPVLAPADGAAIDADGAIAAALGRVPGARLRCLWLPGASGPAWRVSLAEARGIGWAGGRAEVWLQPNGGAVLDVRRHEEASAGEAFLAWQLPLHGGSAFGLPGRIAVCALGFVPLLLAVTGTTIWWRKRRGRRAAQARATSHGRDRDPARGAPV